MAWDALVRVGAQFPDFFRKCGYQFRKTGRLRRRNPFDGVTLGIDAQVFQNQLNCFTPGQCFVITIQVMTVAQVSPHDHDAVQPSIQGIHH